MGKQTPPDESTPDAPAPKGYDIPSPIVLPSTPALEDEEEPGEAGDEALGDGVIEANLGVEEALALLAGASALEQRAVIDTIEARRPYLGSRLDDEVLLHFMQQEGMGFDLEPEKHPFDRARAEVLAGQRREDGHVEHLLWQGATDEAGKDVLALVRLAWRLELDEQEATAEIRRWCTLARRPGEDRLGLRTLRRVPSQVKAGFKRAATMPLPVEPGDEELSYNDLTFIKRLDLIRRERRAAYHLFKRAKGTVFRGLLDLPTEWFTASKSKVDLAIPGVSKNNYREFLTKLEQAGVLEVARGHWAEGGVVRRWFWRYEFRPGRLADDGVAYDYLGLDPAKLGK